MILAASVLARRADRVDRTVVVPARDHATGAFAIAATLLSGGLMVFAGYAGSAWGWGLAAPPATVGGLVIGAAFVRDRRTRTR